MASVDWSNALDLPLALSNLRAEMVGDWHQDPWDWPELSYLKKNPKQVYENCEARGTREPALIDVPKENWGTRPAVVMDVLDRVTYQALVDRLSLDLIGGLSTNAFGWRLPAKDPKAGAYSHNSVQWDAYRSHLSDLAVRHTVALKTDLVACFASMPAEGVQEAIEDRCSRSAVRQRLCAMVEGFADTPNRSGLPQRSLASSVLANMYLSSLDDVLLSHSTAIPLIFRSAMEYRSYARWMDDMWLFGYDVALMRRAQMELQAAALTLGMNLNSGKTDVLEGEEVAEQALEIEHSAVDDAIEDDDFQPLEELIDRVLDSRPEQVSRTTVRFIATRMRTHGKPYRADELLAVAGRMPHAADSLARLFPETIPRGALQDWYLDYASSDWATHEWCVAHFGRMFPSRRRASKPLREFFASAIRDANTSAPMLSVACQRLAAWDPDEARMSCRDAYRRSSSPHARRILALTALGVDEARTVVRKWLKVDPENAPTLAMVEDRGFVPPKVSADFAG